MAQSTTGAGTRVRKVGALRRWLTRPELAAVAGAILVFAFFALVAGHSGLLTSAGTASYLEGAAQLGIVAWPRPMLMIAGESDLSVGSMVGAAGMSSGIAISEIGSPPWAAA